MSLQWFRANVQMGHVGAGKADSRTIYIQAPSAVAAWEEAQGFPGAKKSRRSGAGNSVTPAEVPEGTPRRDLWFWRRKPNRARKETAHA
jgi:hypothetical protein